MALGHKTGGGSRKGRPNKAAAARAAEAAKSGLTPLDYMLRILRDSKADVSRRDWAAEKAAPYVHPRLASLEQKIDASVTINIKRF